MAHVRIRSMDSMSVGMSMLSVREGGMPKLPIV
jgi:hypothetical protein